MTTAVATQAPLPRPGPVPIAAARPRSKPVPTGKENMIDIKAMAPSNVSVGSARSRRERPCDACRRRKSRCVINEGEAICVLCNFHKQDCTFVQSPQPRKRKLNPDSKKEENGAKKRNHDGDATSKLGAASTTSSPALVAHIPKAKANPVLGETLGLQQQRHSRYIGRTTPFDSTLIGLSRFDNRNESVFDGGILRRVNDHECFIMVPDENIQPSTDDTEALMAIEGAVSPHGPALIDLYFRVIHPSFPIIQKKVFLDRYRNGERNFLPPLLANMYILALNWWSTDPKLAPLSRPDASRLQEIHARTFPIAMKLPKLSAIQAGLLFLQRPDAQNTWAWTQQLLAVGQELGLHLDCSNWSIPHWEKGLRKRIAWALYMQDKWGSLIHGRPSHISAANWAVKPVTDDDFIEDRPTSPAIDMQTQEEQIETDRGQVVFAHMISLTAIMAEVLDTFYTQAAISEFENAGDNATGLILSKAKPVQLKLKQWFSNLPPSVKMESSPPESRMTSIGHLHLAYFATEITIHRRIVQSLDAPRADPYMLYICRSAAKTRLISAMDFVNRLKPQHLHAFWYFASKINFTLIGTFGSLLWATAPGSEEAEFYHARLREYRWTLSVSSKRADFLDYAVEMLDTSRSMLNNLPEKPSMGRREPAVDAQSQLRPTLVLESTSDLPPGSGTKYTSAQHFEGFEDEDLEDYSEELETRATGSPSATTTATSENAELAYDGRGGWNFSGQR